MANEECDLDKTEATNGECYRGRAKYYGQKCGSVECSSTVARKCRSSSSSRRNSSIIGIEVAAVAVDQEYNQECGSVEYSSSSEVGVQYQECRSRSAVAGVQ